jgi:putative sterol carrier protein
MRRPAAILALCSALLGGPALAQQPVLMSAEWGKAACDAWNREATLTDQLAASGWAKNDKGRGFKVMQVYRSDCGPKATAEMRISLMGEKAQCVYGGAVQTARLDDGADYVMSAETARWLEMGRGEYGPMKAMMFGRLGFVGPKMEAMSNMGPFESFLLLVGKVGSSAATCPAP